MITLYYVTGISRTDEPLFTSIAQQTSYFTGKAVATIDNTFYPPHFRNRIKIASSDADFNTAFNYLSITFNNKLYYYFIDDIAYLNEDCMELYLTMDTIQTYMFNINIVNGIVSRKSISRWTNTTINTINRDYLRENFTQGEMVFYSKSTNVDGKLGGYILIQTTKMDEDTCGRPTSNLVFDNVKGGQTLDTMPMMCYFIPKPSDPTIQIITSNIIDKTSGTKTTYNTTPSAVDIVVQQLTSNSKNYQLFFVPDLISYLDGRIRAEYGKVTISGSEYRAMIYNADTIVGQWVTLYDVPVFSIGGIVDTSTASDYMEIVRKTQSVTPYTFTPNKAIGQPPSASFVPQLFDSNYIKFVYGETNQFTNFPIEKSVRATLNCNSIVDPQYNNRIYWITPVNSYVDTYETAITCTGSNMPYTATNAMSEYMATHIGTMALTPINTALEVLDNVL